MRRPRVLITSGDPGGIGPELVLRALADPGTGGLADFTAVGAPDYRITADMVKPSIRLQPTSQNMPAAIKSASPSWPQKS